MRKAANIKKYAPIPLLAEGTEFTIDGLTFKVTNVSLNQSSSKEYVAQCDIETKDCRMVLLLTSSKPFAMESENV